VRSYDLRAGKLTEDLIGSPVHCVVPSPQSPKDTYLTSTADGKLRIFDRSNGNCLQTFFGHTVGVTRSKVAWGYGEGAVISGDEEGRIWAWNVLDVSGSFLASVTVRGKLKRPRRNRSIRLPKRRTRG
jgi:mitogen-activated protein kinase organizer 1